MVQGSIRGHFCGAGCVRQGGRMYKGEEEPRADGGVRA